MDYNALSLSFMNLMHEFRKCKPKTVMMDSLRGEPFILQLISINDGNTLPGDLCDEMDVSSARVAVALNNLESKGLITRRIDPADRRRILISLTQEGRTVTEVHSKRILGDIAEMFRRLGEDDATEFVRIVGRLVEMRDAFPITHG